MKGKRILTALVAISVLLTFSLSALAADNTSANQQFKSIDEKIQKLQDLKAKQTKIEALKSELQIIKSLHDKIVTLRKELNALNKDQLRPALKQARQNKNYDGLLAGLNDLKQVKVDLTNIKEVTEQNKSKWDSMRSLRGNKDFDGAMTALKQIEANAQAKIDAYNKAINDAKAVITSLQKTTPSQP